MPSHVQESQQANSQAASQQQAKKTAMRAASRTEREKQQKSREAGKPRTLCRENFQNASPCIAKPQPRTFSFSFSVWLCLYSIIVSGG
jgi:hypothetical protein